jgi:hypothetical protein
MSRKNPKSPETTSQPRKRHAPRGLRGRTPRLFVEELESRLAPSAGPLVFQASEDSSLLLRLSKQDLQFVNLNSSQQVLASVPLTTITAGVQIDGNGHDVRLEIDQSVPQIRGGILFVGGSGTDTLIGPARDTNWHITGAGAGDLDNPGFLRFQGVENLQGAAGNQDTFHVQAGGSVSGLIDGGAGGFDSLGIDGQVAAVISRPSDAHSGRLSSTAYRLHTPDWSRSPCPERPR